MQPDEEAKSVSAETTFDDDLAASDDLVPVLRALSEKVSRAAEEGRHRRPDGGAQAEDARISRSRTRNRQLGDPTRLADRIFQTGLASARARD